MRSEGGTSQLHGFVGVEWVFRTYNIQGKLLVCGCSIEIAYSPLVISVSPGQDSGDFPQKRQARPAFQSTGIAGFPFSTS